MVENQNSEEKILAAAEKVFIRDGYDGARMQAIANEAGINKAMLHYYFRSKEILFEKIFSEKAQHFFPEISQLFLEEKSFIELLELFIEKYIGFISSSPYLPLFVISTINKVGNEGFIAKLPLKEAMLMQIYNAYQKDLDAGKVAAVQPFQLLISVFGMCVFPFLAKPMLHHAFQIKDVEFNQLMQERIIELKMYVRKILIP